MPPATPLAIRRVPLSALHPDPSNARAHNAANLDAIKASLTRFGQAEPLVVQAGSLRLIAGHGRLSAMQALGWTEADIVEGRAVLGSLSQMAPTPPLGVVSVSTLAQFFCDLYAWLQLAESIGTRINVLLFAIGCSASRDEPIAAFVSTIAEQTRFFVPTHVPCVVLFGRPKFTLRHDTPEGWVASLVDAPLHYSSSWSARVAGLSRHGYRPLGDRNFDYLEAVASGDVTLDALRRAANGWTDEVASAIQQEVSRAAIAIGSAAIAQLAQFAVTDSTGTATASSHVEVRIHGEAGHPPRRVVLVIRMGNYHVRSLEVRARSLARLLALVVESNGKDLTWDDVRRRWMEQDRKWKGPVLSVDTLRDYGRRVRRRLTDSGFGEYWMYSPDSVGWAGAVDVVRVAD